MSHPCHTLSNPSAQIFWCRHCMKKFEDPIQRWRHSKICKKLVTTNPEQRILTRDGRALEVRAGTSENQVIVSNLTNQKDKTNWRKQKNVSELNCYICKKEFDSFEAMKEHVRKSCNRPETGSPREPHFLNKESPFLIRTNNENVSSHIESLLRAAQQQQQREEQLKQQHERQKLQPVQDAPYQTLDDPSADVSLELLADASLLQQLQQVNPNMVYNHVTSDESTYNLPVENMATNESQPIENYVTNSAEPMETVITEVHIVTHPDAMDQTMQGFTQEEASSVQNTFIPPRCRLPDSVHSNCSVVLEKVPLPISTSDHEYILLNDGSVAESGYSVLVSDETPCLSNTKDIKSHQKRKTVSDNMCSILKSKKQKTQTTRQRKPGKDISPNDADMCSVRNVSRNTDANTNINIEKSLTTSNAQINSNLDTCERILPVSQEISLNKDIVNSDVQVTLQTDILNGNVNVSDGDKGREPQRESIPCILGMNKQISENQASQVSSKVLPEENKGSSSDSDQLQQNTVCTKVTQKEILNEVTGELELVDVIEDEDDIPETYENLEMISVDSCENSCSDEGSKLAHEESKLSSSKFIDVHKAKGTKSSKSNNSLKKDSKEKCESKEAKYLKEKDSAKETKAQPKKKQDKPVKCKICDKEFKSVQILQKHNKVPCKIKHTRNLTQKVLRPKRSIVQRVPVPEPKKKKTNSKTNNNKHGKPKLLLSNNRRYSDTNLSLKPKKGSKNKNRRKSAPEYNFNFSCCKQYDNQNTNLQVNYESLSEKEQYFFHLDMIPMSYIPNDQRPFVLCNPPPNKVSLEKKTKEELCDEFYLPPPVLEKIPDIEAIETNDLELSCTGNADHDLEPPVLWSISEMDKLPETSSHVQNCVNIDLCPENKNENDVNSVSEESEINKAVSESVAKGINSDVIKRSYESSSKPAEESNFNKTSSKSVPKQAEKCATNHMSYASLSEQAKGSDLNKSSCESLSKYAEEGKDSKSLFESPSKRAENRHFSDVIAELSPNSKKKICIKSLDMKIVDLSPSKYSVNRHFTDVIGKSPDRSQPCIPGEKVGLDECGNLYNKQLTKHVMCGAEITDSTQSSFSERKCVQGSQFFNFGLNNDKSSGKLTIGVQTESNSPDKITQSSSSTSRRLNFQTEESYNKKICSSDLENTKLHPARNLFDSISDLSNDNISSHSGTLADEKKNCFLKHSCQKSVVLANKCTHSSHITTATTEMCGCSNNSTNEIRKRHKCQEIMVYPPDPISKPGPAIETNTVSSNNELLEMLAKSLGIYPESQNSLSGQTKGDESVQNRSNPNSSVGAGHKSSYLTGASSNSVPPASLTKADLGDGNLQIIILNNSTTTNDYTTDINIINVPKSLHSDDKKSKNAQMVQNSKHPPTSTSKNIYVPLTESCTPLVNPEESVEACSGILELPRSPVEKFPINSLSSEIADKESDVNCVDISMEDLGLDEVHVVKIGKVKEIPVEASKSNSITELSDSFIERDSNVMTNTIVLPPTHSQKFKDSSQTKRKMKSILPKVLSLNRNKVLDHQNSMELSAQNTGIMSRCCPKVQPQGSVISELNNKSSGGLHSHCSAEQNRNATELLNDRNNREKTLNPHCNAGEMNMTNDRFIVNALPNNSEKTCSDSVIFNNSTVIKNIVDSAKYEHDSNTSAEVKNNSATSKLGAHLHSMSDTLPLGSRGGFTQNSDNGAHSEEIIDNLLGTFASEKTSEEPRVMVQYVEQVQDPEDISYIYLDQTEKGSPVDYSDGVGNTEDPTLASIPISYTM